MNDWNLPKDVNELFANVPTSYHIIDHDYSGDNIYAMSLFVDNVTGLGDFITLDDGTQITATKDGKTIVIDSGGLGDFHMHGYDVTLSEAA